AQNSETRQQTDETRTDGTRRHRVFSFDQHAYGLQAQFNKAFTTGSVEHAVTYGFEGTRTEIRQKRDGYELGLRFIAPAAYVSVSGYYNDYKDFIQSNVDTGRNAQGLTVFQSQNIAEARIYGAEMKAGIEFGELSPALKG
ncbi:TonB-dependent receptor domain-containing protein, partial [Klebsiella pneumoniae]|uniref:TonB-dependent receptor n=1 Tax=Klebsiella pneumoniae TaxID=573 RepID=UPI003D35E784